MSYFQLLICSLIGNRKFYDINETMSNWKIYTFHDVKTFWLVVWNIFDFSIYWE